MIGRTKKLIQVGYFLSRFGVNQPPIILGAELWKEAYHIFFEKLNDGRTISAFEHTLKNSRDVFDGHFKNTNREGWKEKDGSPRKLNNLSLEVFNEFSDKSEKQVWEFIAQDALIRAVAYDRIFEDLAAIEESEEIDFKAKTEGGIKIVISSKIERDPSLRNYAFAIYGYDCMVCGFNYETTYGEWGREWAEVHHIEALADRKGVKAETDPETDLAVVCANCHRMLHRKRGITLSLSELRGKIRH